MNYQQFGGYPPQYFGGYPGQMPYGGQGFFVPFQMPNGMNVQMPYGMYPEQMQQMYMQQPMYPGMQVSSDQSEKPETSNATSVDGNESNKTDENESHIDPSATSNMTPSHTSLVVPKNVVNGIVVCAKPMELMSVQEEVVLPEGPYLSLVVECVATGIKHTDRAVAHVSLVDENQNVILNIYINPSDPITSYLKSITNLDEITLDKYGLQHSEAMKIIKDAIPPNAVLVGHNIYRHIGRLGLQKSVDFRDALDLAECWRVWNKNFQDYTKFSLNHESLVLLKVRSSGFVPNDAILQMKVLQLYLNERSSVQNLYMKRIELMSTPVEKPVHKHYPIFEGVCLGHRKSCECGAPFIDWHDVYRTSCVKVE